MFIRKPNDLHIHLRDSPGNSNIIYDAAKQYQNVLVMPNLVPPILTKDDAESYKDRILNTISNSKSFNPIMTLYLHENTSLNDINDHNNIFKAIKLYPHGVTTNSESGVNLNLNTNKFARIFDEMQENNLILCIHGEVNNVNKFDREQIFINNHLIPLIKKFPKLKIVLEHVSTEYGVNFIKEQNNNIAATITAHHLHLTTNNLFDGNYINSNNYCFPIVKSGNDRQSLIDAATSGDTHFFLGSDSAPHTAKCKSSTNPPGGIYTGYNSVGLYLEIFENKFKINNDNRNFIDKFEKFSSINGANFYNLNMNLDLVEIVKGDWLVPNSIKFKDDVVIPFRANEIIKWKTF
jgi:dihydroorotase